MIVIDDGDEQTSRSTEEHLGPFDSTIRRISKRLESERTKATAASREINLVDPVETASRDIIDADAVDLAPRARCFTCQSDALTTNAACGHSFCRTCIETRCRQAIANDRDGGIAFPLRCCNALLPLKLVRPALSRQLYTRHMALVAKREGDWTQLVKRKRSAGKQKAKATTASVPVALDVELPQKRVRVSLTRVGGAFHAVDSPASSVHRSETFECVACLDQIGASAQQFRSACGHVYCSECLALMARASLTDCALVPIRCCGKELPAEYVAPVLPKRSMGTYNRFVAEKGWKTSTLKSDKEYAELVQSMGGQQCPKCDIGVEKISGCNAMTCSHGHRFCWSCLQETCTCGGIYRYTT